MSELDRRKFLKVAGGVSAHALLGASSPAWAETPSFSANDNIQIALIGAGGQGQSDTKWAVQVPGVKLVAVADCYDGRLAHSKELWGNDLFVTRDYKEILARKDIDAVIIGTPDHWHKQASIDAMNAGKDVYCEKPMIHLYSDGPEMIAAAQRNNRIMQLGSQRNTARVVDRGSLPFKGMSERRKRNGQNGRDATETKKSTHGYQPPRVGGRCQADNERGQVRCGS